MRRSPAPATLESIAQALDALNRHVEALDRDMVRLAARIVPYQDELDRLGGISRQWQWPGAEEREKPTLDTIYKMLREADRHIELIEFDFAAVRSILERLDNDVYLRAELKPYLTDDPARRKRRS